MPTSCDRISNYGGKGTFVIFACILSLAASLVLVKPRPKIQAKMAKVPFPHSLRFCHNWLAPGDVPGVRYAEKLSELFYLHSERFWLGVITLSFNLK